MPSWALSNVEFVRLVCSARGALHEHRFAVQHPSGPTGTASLVLDLTNLPTTANLTAVAAGETWSWQAWYRAVDGGGAATPNLSSAVGALSTDRASGSFGSGGRTSVISRRARA